MTVLLDANVLIALLVDFLGPGRGHYWRSNYPGACSAPPATDGMNQH